MKIIEFPQEYTLATVVCVEHGFVMDLLCSWSAESAFNPDVDAPVCPSLDCLMLGTEVDLQQVENSVLAMEMVLKAWLQEQGGDKEHLHLLLPSPVDNPIPGTGTAHKHKDVSPLLYCM